MKLKAIAIGVAMAVTGVANASITVPGSDVNNTGGSELVFNLFDRTSGASYSVDLGVAYSDTGSISTAGSLFDTTELAGISSFWNGGSLNSSLEWNVVAADSTLAGASVAEYGMRILTTATAETFSFNNGNVEDAGLNMNAFIDGVNLEPGQSGAVNGSSYVTSTTAASWMQSMGTTGWESGQFNSSTNVNDSLFFLSIDESVDLVSGRGGSAPTADVTKAAIFNTLGSFSLSSTGDLTYSAVGAGDPVPLPAAVWMFGAGLMGLVGVARRRKDAVAA